MKAAAKAFQEKEYTKCKEILIQSLQTLSSSSSKQIVQENAGEVDCWIPSISTFRDSLAARIKRNLLIVSKKLYSNDKQDEILSTAQSGTEDDKGSISNSESFIDTKMYLQVFKYNKAVSLYKTFKYEETLQVYTSDSILKSQQQGLLVWTDYHADPLIYLKTLLLLYESGFHLQMIEVCIRMTEKLESLFRFVQDYRRDLFAPFLPDASFEIKRAIMLTLKNRLSFLHPNSIPLISDIPVFTTVTDLASNVSSLQAKLHQTANDQHSCCFIDCFTASVHSMNVCASLDDQKASSKHVVLFRNALKSPLHDALYYYYLALMNMEAKKITAAAAFAKRAMNSVDATDIDELFRAKLNTLSLFQEEEDNVGKESSSG